MSTDTPHPLREKVEYTIFDRSTSVDWGNLIDDWEGNPPCTWTEFVTDSVLALPEIRRALAGPTGDDLRAISKAHAADAGWNMGAHYALMSAAAVLDQLARRAVGVDPEPTPVPAPKLIVTVELDWADANQLQEAVEPIMDFIAGYQYDDVTDHVGFSVSTELLNCPRRPGVPTEDGQQ